MSHGLVSRPFLGCASGGGLGVAEGGWDVLTISASSRSTIFTLATTKQNTFNVWFVK